MKRSNGAKTTTTARKSSSSSTKLSRSPVISKTGNSESAGDRVLELGITEDTSGEDLSTESVELTAITLHQPWASLVAKGWKQYETRDWPTNHRGPIVIHAGRKPKGKQELREHDKVVASFKDLLNEDCPYSSVIAIAELTDVVCMTDEFIKQQSPTELRCGNWAVGRYAFKLENVRAIAPIPALGKQGLWKWETDSEKIKINEFINEESEKVSKTTSLRRSFLEFLSVHRDARNATDAFGNTKSDHPSDYDCGEVQHLAEEDGQLNLLEFDSNEPPDPDDYPGDLEAFKKAYLAWAELQKGTAEEEYQHITPEEIWNQSTNGNGSICVQELAQVSPTPESNCGEEALTISASGTAIAAQSLPKDSPASTELTTSKNATSNSAAEYSSSLLARLAPHSQLMETDSEPTTQETASPTYSEESENYSQISQLSKTSQDCSVAPIPPAINQEPTLDLSSTPYPRAGTMQNGLLSAAPILPPPGVESGSLLLRSPGGLSSTGETRPPGKTRLETQLNQLGLIQDGEVAAPEFLEAGYRLPIGFTNPAENRSAMELSQVQPQQFSIVPKSELLAETETTETDEKPLGMPSTGELQPLGLNELNISVPLPPNIGALSKTELIGMAQEQHQLICVIERKKFKLAFEKLYRIHVTGLFLMEFKKRCQYGEFVEQLEAHGINPRVAQNYTLVSKNWKTIEAKAHQSALLSENNESPNFGINWALQVIREEKKQLKSAAPPKDPDGWRTPNTSDQPVVSLVKKALGGQIYFDPCSDSGCNIPATMRYFKWNDGLAKHNIWEKTVFVNPPFSDPFPWVERCCFEFARGNVSAAIMLLKAGVVSNVGTGELINKYASAICHWRGRIHFLNDEGNPIKGSDFDCVFVYFGARLDLFRDAFGGRGTIATIENHYSSVNKKHLLKSEIPEFGNTQAEQKHLAAAVGLGNGRSVLPDMRDADRERNERYDPHTVVDVLSSSMPTASSKPVPVSENLAQPIGEAETFDETPLATRQIQKAKENCLNDYVTAISSNLSEFSDEQIAFLAKIINEESVKRIGF
jgi:hypothetical protein